MKTRRVKQQIFEIDSHWQYFGWVVQKSVSFHSYYWYIELGADL